MSEDNNKNSSKNKDKAMSAEDASVWQSMTHDVKRLPGKRYDDGSKPSDSEAEPDERAGSETIIPLPASPAPLKAPQGNELDRRTEDRLRKGKMPIEATLDLHGMIQDEAHEALTRFIEHAYGQGKRCVLVITGKGQRKNERQTGSADWLSPKPGILKRRVPDWLTQTPLQPLVLKALPAKQKDGGEGALYVYLRRKR